LNCSYDVTLWNHWCQCWSWQSN